VVTLANGSAHAFNSHWAKAVPEGGNYLYNDGHAKWKWFKNMRQLANWSGVTFYW
jgi:prepilin-type processing-associated H-X9-DG protein